MLLIIQVVRSHPSQNRIFLLLVRDCAVSSLLHAVSNELADMLAFKIGAL